MRSHAFAGLEADGLASEPAEENDRCTEEKLGASLQNIKYTAQLTVSKGPAEENRLRKCPKTQRTRSRHTPMDIYPSRKQDLMTSALLRLEDAGSYYWGTEKPYGGF